MKITFPSGMSIEFDDEVGERLVGMTEAVMRRDWAVPDDYEPGNPEAGEQETQAADIIERELERAKNDLALEENVTSLVKAYLAARRRPDAQEEIEKLSFKIERLQARLERQKDRFRALLYAVNAELRSISVSEASVELSKGYRVVGEDDANGFTWSLEKV